MTAVKVVITRYVDDSQPGWVECRLVDAADREWLFVEKVPIVTAVNLGEDTVFPCPGVIACEIVSRRRGPRGHELVMINTESPWGIESTSGCASFEVEAEQLVSG
jgi:hypothetical protein